MTARYYRPPALEHEQFFCCENEQCFNIIGYLPEDVTKRVKSDTLSFERFVVCAVCNKERIV